MKCEDCWYHHVHERMSKAGLIVNMEGHCSHVAHPGAPSFPEEGAEECDHFRTPEQQRRRQSYIQNMRSQHVPAQPRWKTGRIR